MPTSRRLLVVAAVIWSLAGVAAALGASARQEPMERSLESRPERMALMEHHFASVSALHTALIRGNLGGVRAPAEALSAMAVPPEVPAVATPHVEAIRAAARRAAAAKSIIDAATATASMLRHCGDCHRQVGVFPPLRAGDTYESSPTTTAHMREHQRAADLMLNGLVVPSSQQWSEGAERFSHAPLQPSQLPSDRNLNAEIRAAETDVHRIAERAMRAETPADRVAPYAELLTTCATCHAKVRAR